MNLQSLLAARVDAGKPVRVGLIGAGKFGSMFLAQVPSIAGLEVAMICDLDPERAKAACRTVGWDAGADRAHAFRRATAAMPVSTNASMSSSRRPAILARALRMRSRRSRPASISSWSMSRPMRWPAPIWPRKARAANVIYSLAYGDQPALIAEMVDWARAAGFEVTAAGKGTKYLPAYHTVTPDGVWQHYGLTAAEAKARRHEFADVQLVSGRHQVGDRNGGGGQCLRARRAA